MICRPNNGSLNWRYPRVFTLLHTLLRLSSHYPQEEPQQKRNQWIWYFIPGTSSPAPSAGNEAIVLPSSSSPTGLGVPRNWIRHWTVGRRPGSVDNLIDSWEITGFASPTLSVDMQRTPSRPPGEGLLRPRIVSLGSVSLVAGNMED